MSHCLALIMFHSETGVQVTALDYVDADAEIKPEGYQATVVTTKPCKLLSIPATDLLRFGSGVKEAVQEVAWVRRDALAGRAERATQANANLGEAVGETRRTSSAMPAAAQACRINMIYAVAPSLAK